MSPTIVTGAGTFGMLASLERISLTILRRKEFLEAQLDQVERDLKLMSKEQILVDLNK